MPTTRSKWRASSKLARPVAQPISSARPRFSVIRAGNVYQRFAVVRRAEVVRPVLEVEILRNHAVGFIRVQHLFFLMAGDHIAEACMLEEVTAEGVAGRFQRFVTGGDPATAFDQRMFAIKGWRGEVVI